MCVCLREREIKIKLKKYATVSVTYSDHKPRDTTLTFNDHKPRDTTFFTIADMTYCG